MATKAELEAENDALKDKIAGLEQTLAETQAALEKALAAAPVEASPPEVPQVPAPVSGPSLSASGVVVIADPAVISAGWTQREGPSGDACIVEVTGPYDHAKAAVSLAGYGFDQHDPAATRHTITVKSRLQADGVAGAVKRWSRQSGKPLSASVHVLTSAEHRAREAAARGGGLFRVGDAGEALAVPATAVRLAGKTLSTS